MDNGSVLAYQRFQETRAAPHANASWQPRCHNRRPGILGQFDDLGSEEKEEKDVLFDTFMAWRANKGSADNAAAQLHVHPNTVRHRLRRIEANTGRSLAVPDELAELCLACEIRENMSAP
jgi:hypothetical protein